MTLFRSGKYNVNTSLCDYDILRLNELEKLVQNQEIMLKEKDELLATKESAILDLTERFESVKVLKPEDEPIAGSSTSGSEVQILSQEPKRYVTSICSFILTYSCFTDLLKNRLTSSSLFFREVSSRRNQATDSNVKFVIKSCPISTNLFDTFYVLKVITGKLSFH